MSAYPKGPREMTKGMMYFPRMLDKIRLHARGELHEDYHKNLGAVKAADGVCCNFLRVHYRDLHERVRQGGTDEEILEWCFEKGRRLIDKAGVPMFAADTLDKIVPKELAENSAVVAVAAYALANMEQPLPR